MATQRCIELRIRLTDPPTFADDGSTPLALYLLVGEDGFVPPVDGLLTAEARVSLREDGTPNFLGKACFGPPKDRFLYVAVRKVEGDGELPYRRIKVRLASISWPEGPAPAGFACAITGRGAASVPFKRAWTPFFED